MDFFCSRDSGSVFTHPPHHTLFNIVGLSLFEIFATLSCLDYEPSGGRRCSERLARKPSNQDQSKNTLLLNDRGFPFAHLVKVPSDSSAQNFPDSITCFGRIVCRDSEK